MVPTNRRFTRRISRLRSYPSINRRDSCCVHQGRKWMARIRRECQQRGRNSHCDSGNAWAAVTCAKGTMRRELQGTGRDHAWHLAPLMGDGLTNSAEIEIHEDVEVGLPAEDRSDIYGGHREVTMNERKSCAIVLDSTSPKLKRGTVCLWGCSMTIHSPMSFGLLPFPARAHDSSPPCFTMSKTTNRCRCDRPLPMFKMLVGRIVLLCAVS